MTYVLQPILILAQDKRTFNMLEMILVLANFSYSAAAAGLMDRS